MFDMTPEQESKLFIYLETLQSPLEQYFFTEQQKQEIAKSKAKLESSRAFVASVIEKDDFEELIQKAVLEGRIYTPSQAASVGDLFTVLEEHDGARIDIQETLVNKSGQCVIMSGKLTDALGLFGDTYILNEEADDLVNAMRNDGVPGPEIDKVTAALNKYGAVVLQAGVFVGLKNLLEDTIGRKISTYVPQAKDSQPSTPTPQIKTGEEMPIGFIEYLKNHEKGYDRVESDVMIDPNFIAFFDNLKQHYVSYKNLPIERMAQEVILRPVLWNKLQPATQNAVQDMVDKHRAHFQNIVKQVATVSGLSKLEELKKNLGK